jgi:hypothetical protein
LAFRTPFSAHGFLFLNSYADLVGQAASGVEGRRGSPGSSLPV